MAKRIIISSDVGFNGMKTVVGEFKDGELFELFNMHNSSDIFKNDRKKIANVQENALYIISTESNNEMVRYIAGDAAKEDYITQYDATNNISDKFYTISDNSAEDYQRFTTKEFTMLHLAVLYEALDKLSAISEYSDIMTNPENYELVVIVELPEAISEEASVQTYIESYITDPNKQNSFKFSTENFDSVVELPEVLHNAKVLFTSQVYAAAVCEITSYDISEDEVKDMLPMFVFDCGGKTDGIALITKTFELGDKRESNRDFSINRICYNVSKDIEKKFNYELRPEQIEAKATSENKRVYVIHDLNSDNQPVTIDVKELYKKEVEKAIKGLFDYTVEKYGRELASCYSYLISGGAGDLYYSSLAKYIKEYIATQFDEELSNEKKYILAKGKFGDKENGSIFAVAVGGLQLAANIFD